MHACATQGSRMRVSPMERGVIPVWYYDRLGQPIGMERWGVLHADQDYKVVEQTQVGPYWVSTVWLGIDHSFVPGSAPVIFETMVFATSDDVRELGPDLDCQRYSTEDAARQGHADMVTLVRATTIDVDEGQGNGS